MLDFSVPGDLKNDFHFPSASRDPRERSGGRESGCKGAWMTRLLLHGERHEALGNYFEVPVEASKDCLVASGL